MFALGLITYRLTDFNKPIRHVGPVYNERTWVSIPATGRDKNNLEPRLKMTDPMLNVKTTECHCFNHRRQSGGFGCRDPQDFGGSWGSPWNIIRPYTSYNVQEWNKNTFQSGHFSEI